MKAVHEGIVSPKNGSLTNNARLLAQTAQKLTPPKNAKQGTVAVKRDTNRAARAIAAKSFDDKRLQAIVRRNNQTAWNAASRHFKKAGVKGTHAHNFTPRIYQQARGSRGRVLRNSGDVLLGPQGTAGRRHVRKTVKRVGWAKAGWNRALFGLHGKPTGVFVKKQGMGHGSFNRSPSRRGLAYTAWIKFSNNTAWGRDTEAQRIARDALKIRTNAMRKNFELSMKRAARRRR